MTGFKASIYRRERKYRPSASYRKEEENGNGTHEKWFRPISSKFLDRKSALDPWRADDRRNARRMKITLIEKKRLNEKKERKKTWKKVSNTRRKRRTSASPSPHFWRAEGDTNLFFFNSSTRLRQLFSWTLRLVCDSSPIHTLAHMTSSWRYKGN